jgi:hypothetical protein
MRRSSPRTRATTPVTPPRRPEGQALFAPVAVSDVVVENFLPGTPVAELAMTSLPPSTPASSCCAVRLRSDGTVSQQYSFDRSGWPSPPHLPDRLSEHPPVARLFHRRLRYRPGSVRGWRPSTTAMAPRDATGGRRPLTKRSGGCPALANEYVCTGRSGAAGNVFTGVSPAEQFQTADGRVQANHGQRPHVRAALRNDGEPDLAKEPRIAGRGGRVAHMAELHERIGR